MDVKTLDDARRASEITGIPVESIARALGFLEYEGLRESLRNATTQEERWKIWQKATYGSDVETEALREILKHSTTEEEGWNVYEEARDESDVQNAAIRYIISHI